METVRLYEMPACRMVASGYGMFGDGVLERFMAWMETQPRSVFPKDFLGGDEKGFVWYYLYEEGMSVPEGLNVVDFPGGLYAVACGIDENEADYVSVMAELERFIEQNPPLEKDPARMELGNVITSPAAQEALGYCQMDYYKPVRIASKD